MARRPRIHAPGIFLHVFDRGNAGQRIFHDRSDWEFFLDRTMAVKGKAPFRLLAYCLVPNHFHLLIQVMERRASDIMQQILSPVARRFNMKNDRTGHLFQPRHGQVHIEDDAQLWAVFRYIARNPVKAGLAAVPEDWEWSSHREMTGERAGGLIDRPEARRYFDQDAGRAVSVYRALVQGREPAMILQVRLPDFETADEGLSALALNIAREHGISVDDLRAPVRDRRPVEARRAFAKRAKNAGCAWGDISKFLNITQAGAKYLVRT